MSEVLVIKEEDRYVINVSLPIDLYNDLKKVKGFSTEDLLGDIFGPLIYESITKLEEE